MTSRPYRSDGDLRLMQQLVVDVWRVGGAPQLTHVGDLAWRRYMHSGREHEWRIRLWEEDGRCLAWAWLDASGAADHEVHPTHRDRLVHEVLDWLEAEAGEDLRLYALSSDAAALRRLEGRAYAGTTDMHYHLRELPAEPPPELREGYRLRTVGPDDLAQRVELHRVVWHPSRVTPESYANVMRAWPYRADLDCVVEGPGRLAAYCLAWLDEENRVGELEPVGTHPDHRRRGFSAAVCRFALAQLHAAGARRVVVYSVADPANSAPTALYRSLGFRDAAQILELRKPASR